MLAPQLMHPVFQGGLKLADPEAGNEDRASPLRHTATLPSPSLTGGLQAVRRHLSMSNSAGPGASVPAIDQALAGASGMLQIPHFFWNHLSTATTMNGNTFEHPSSDGQNTTWDDLFNFEDSTIDTTAVDQEPWGIQSSGQMGGDAGYANQQPAPPWSVPIAAGTSYPTASFPQRDGVSGDMRTDQAAISAALMSFMSDMTKAAPSHNM